MFHPHSRLGDRPEGPDPPPASDLVGKGGQPYPRAPPVTSPVVSSRRETGFLNPSQQEDTRVGVLGVVGTSPCIHSLHVPKYQLLGPAARQPVYRVGIPEIAEVKPHIHVKNVFRQQLLSPAAKVPPGDDWVQKSRPPMIM